MGGMRREPLTRVVPLALIHNFRPQNGYVLLMSFIGLLGVDVNALPLIGRTATGIAISISAATFVTAVLMKTLNVVLR